MSVSLLNLKFAITHHIKLAQVFKKPGLFSLSYIQSSFTYINSSYVQSPEVKSSQLISIYTTYYVYTKKDAKQVLK